MVGTRRGRMPAMGWFGIFTSVIATLLFALAMPAGAWAVNPSLHVSPSGSDSGDCISSPCLTIQYAVNQAAAGGRVEVAAGTYDEPQIVVQRPLNLQGAGAGQTIVDGSSASSLAGDGMLRFQKPSAGNFTVSGFTLEGANSSGPSGEPMLITFAQVPAGSQVTVAENEFLASAALDPDLSTDFSLGIYSSGSGADLTIEDNHFTGMWQGILIEHSTGAATIAGNEFANLVPTGAGAAVYPAEGVFLLADGKSGGAGDAVSSAQAISENYFHDYTGLGIIVQAGHPSITTTSPNSFSDVTIAGNRIALAGATIPPEAKPLAGIALKTGHAGSTISAAEVTGNSVAVSAPGEDIAVSGAVSGTGVHANRIVGGSAIGLDATAASSAVDASENWWGCNAGPTSDGSNACGTISGDVDANPWLVLSVEATPEEIAFEGATSTVSAAIDTDSAGDPAAPAPDGTPVAFGTNLGSLNPSGGQLAAGDAETTLTSGDTSGLAQVTATVDAQTVEADVAFTQPPFVLALPLLTGNAQVGSVLSCSDGVWNGYPAPTFTHQWRRDAVDIVGAVGPTYTSVAADIGHEIGCVVTASNGIAGGEGNTAGSSSIQVTQAPVNTAPPTVTGDALVGSVLSCADGAWNGFPALTFTRQWRRDGVDIPAAVGSTYTSVAADVGHQISCAVTATNTASASAGSNAVTVTAPAPPPPAPSDPPSVAPPSKPVTVVGSQPTVGTLSCGSSSCQVNSTSGNVTIAGKKVKVRVKVPASISANGSAPIKIVLSRSVKQALAKGKTGTVRIKVTLTDATGQTFTRSITVKIKPTKR
jgi:hypothetical protein